MAEVMDHADEIEHIVAVHEFTDAMNSALIEAAEELRRLRADLEKAKAALRPFAEIELSTSDGDDEIPDEWDLQEAPYWTLKAAAVRHARTTLAEIEDRS